MRLLYAVPLAPRYDALRHAYLRLLYEPTRATGARAPNFKGASRKENSIYSRYISTVLHVNYFVIYFILMFPFSSLYRVRNLTDIKLNNCYILNK